MDKLKVNKNFAEHYNKYRKAEELQKLKERYGDAGESDSDSSSETEDETAEALNPKIEKDFFHTLACIRRKDPVLYKPDEKFFDDPPPEHDPDTNSSDEVKAKKKKPFLLKDYERKVIMEMDGKYEDEEKINHDKDVPGSYYAELDEIKKSFADEAKKHDEDNNDGDIIKRKDCNNNDFEKDVGTKIEDLDGYWQNPELNEKDKFLRDYFLDKKYLNTESDVSSDEDQSEEEEQDDNEDELFVTQQEEFEHAFNLRHEEQDHHFIRSYPRKISDSVRRTDDKKKKKRSERKTRKENEKKKKIEELKRFKQLKREEIMEKIGRLRAATGNTDIKFNDEDINDEFNTDTHDKRMQELFDKEFYGDADEEKPQFSDIGEDDFGEDTNWEQYNDYDEDGQYDESVPECERSDFVMDCDYQPKVSTKKKNKKTETADKKKKKSKFYDVVAKQGGKEGEKSMSKHLEEYYAMDFDDLIGDLPCRFKYREVPKNDYGLSTEEILLADKGTLNSWCSLRRVVQYRSADEEKNLRQSYMHKSRTKKKKCFDKFFENIEEKDKKPTEEEEESTADEPSTQIVKRKLNSRQRRRKRDRDRFLKLLGIDTRQESNLVKKPKSKKRKDDTPRNDTYRRLSKLDTSRLEAYGLKPKKVLKKAKYGLNNNTNNTKKKTSS